MILLGQFSQFLLENMHCGYSLVAPNRALLKSSHNICFYGELGNIVPELSPNTLFQQILCRSCDFSFKNCYRF